MNARVNIAPLLPEDWPSVLAIYLEGIQTGLATFACEAPEWFAWDADHLQACRLVARDGARVLGWAALSPTSRRAVYAGVAEVSIYIAAHVRGYGVGKRLLSALIADSEAHGVWTLQGSIFPENTASLALHTSCGFRVVGYRELIGQLHGVWRNTVLVERRSGVVGVVS
ncbi:MAG: N-acetyltransferase [Anaerolineae bacterium]|nr:N-acetyltransferase [Anaerolineae bacterium]